MTPEQLFEQNRGLAVHLAAKYARRYPRVELDALAQESLIALWRSTRSHDPATGCPFAPYAMQGILWAIWHHVNRNAFPTPEVSLDEVVEGNNGDLLTRRDAVDHQHARRLESLRRAEEHEMRCTTELEKLITTLETLTDRERVILQLQYVQHWPVPRIAQHLDRSASIISTESARGIRKLRQAMAERGYRALAPTDPVVGPITGRPPRRNPQARLAGSSLSRTVA